MSGDGFLTDAEEHAVLQGCEDIAEAAMAESRELRSLCERAVEIWPTDWVASPDLLCRTAQLAAREHGSVLDVGTGLSTLVLAAIATRTNARVHALEHDETWYTRIIHLLAGSRHVVIHHAPIVTYDDYDWYRIPDDLPPHFGLVLCDGPPGGTRGGRTGLTSLGDRIRSSVILLDDTHRHGEQQVLQTWGRELGATWTLRKPNRVRVFARKIREAYHRKSFAEVSIP